MGGKEVFSYRGTKMIVKWNGRLCIHVGECGQSAGELFVGGREPWCDPDRASPGEIMQIVRRCPSGALSLTTPEGTPVELAEDENTVTVACNGPCFVRGDLDIEDADATDSAIRHCVALCRCGHSANKPFCDNSHQEIGFSDYGAIGETGPGFATAGGKLKIRFIRNGPISLEGNVSLITGSGRRAWQGTQTALCRCGASRNKPFCDGSHVKAGFRA